MKLPPHHHIPFRLNFTMSKERTNHWLQPGRNGPMAQEEGGYMGEKQPYQFMNEASTDSSTAERWIHKLRYLKEMIVGVDLFIVVIAASAVTFFANHLGKEWTSDISDSKPAIATLGAFYSFAGDL